jgi:hypothetical protein
MDLEAESKRQTKGYGSRSSIKVTNEGVRTHKELLKMFMDSKINLGFDGSIEKLCIG